MIFLKSIYLQPYNMVMNNATLIVTTSSNSTVQVPTLPVQLSADRDFAAADIWAEKILAAARSASNDSSRFAANLLADLSY